VTSKIVEYFTDLAEKHGQTPGAVGMSARSQRKRFAIVDRIGDLNGRSLLDVGCGCGHFWNHLAARGIQTDYVGIDVTPAQIAGARAINPGIANRFILGDVMVHPFDRTFDYVIANGPLNVGCDEPVGTMLHLIERMYQLCSIGMVVTMTSALTRKPSSGVHYYDPSEILKRITRITQNVRVDHTYLPHDFAVFCYRQDLYD
jgi:SAM-dependent methyltransferase